MFLFFFFNDTATTEIYTLSLHDALPICRGRAEFDGPALRQAVSQDWRWRHRSDGRRRTILRCRDRKSTRLNSSHSQISYAVFCLKKKKKKIHESNTSITDSGRYAQPRFA